MLRVFYIFCFISFVCFAKAQELNVIVNVNTPQLQKTDPKLFQDLERDLQDFLNNQSFTNEFYEQHEKIKCNFQLTIRDEIGGGTFTADLAIQSTRPVFASEYESVVLTYSDSDVKFDYAIGTPIQFAADGYINNLSSIFSYWAMIIIGLDYDTFKPQGGEEYFQKARNIVTAVPTNIANQVKGWQGVDSDRNRFWLVENLLNPKVADYRQAMYRYHRQGLDIMHNNVYAGQQSINDALGIVKSTRDAYPNNMIVQLFAIAKAEEIVEIMAKANRGIQKNTYAIMSSIDPSNRAIYIQLR
jgi:hypothetical protein